MPDIVDRLRKWAKEDPKGANDYEEAACVIEAHRILLDEAWEALRLKNEICTPWKKRD